MLADAVQKGFDARSRACIARVTIGFDDGVWLPFHNIIVEVERERVGAAGVVRAPDGVDVFHAANLVSGAQIALSVAPEYRMEHGHIGTESVGVDGDGNRTLFAQNRRNI